MVDPLLDGLFGHYVAVVIREKMMRDGVFKLDEYDCVKRSPFDYNTNIQ